MNEEIQINADGSGTYVTKMDMSQLIDMMQTFAGEEELTKEGLDRVIDTTILMKSLMDSAKDVTAEQKELMKNGKMKLQMNIKEKIFKMDMNLPYKNYNSLQQLMAGQGGNGAGLADVFKNMFGKGDTAGQPAAPKDPGMDALAGIYDVTVKNGLISKKLNTEKFKALLDKPEMAQVKQLGSSGMEILCTTSIKLPRAVKKSDNPLIKLSDDKKTVTMKYNLLELLETPDKFSYTIEY
jgi:ClpP class serine protease